MLVYDSILKEKRKDNSYITAMDRERIDFY